MFDVNKDRLITISEESYCFLSKVLDGSFGADSADYSADMPDELARLREAGYLSAESSVREIRHYYSDYLGQLLSRKLSKITLQLTQDCNLRCTYCVYTENEDSLQRTHSRKKMTWETVEKSIDFLWSRSVDSQFINVGFYGGEPLLEFSLIKRTIAHCNEKFRGKNTTYNITTNGTLLTDEMIRYFIEHNVSVMISLDGPKEINDRNRVFVDGSGTFDAVMERIRRIKQTFPALAEKLHISVVLDTENDYDCVNEFYVSLDDLDFSVSYIDNDHKSAESYSYSEDYIAKSVYHRFLSLLAQFGRVPKSEFSVSANASIERVVSEHRLVGRGASLHAVDSPSGPCIPGQLRLFVTADGNFIPCERVNETSPAMNIGNLDDGFYLENALRILNFGKISEGECVKCWCFRYCELCAKKADVKERDLSAERKLLSCSGVRSNVYEKFRSYLLFKEIPTFYRGSVLCAESDETVSARAAGGAGFSQEEGERW